MKFETNQHCQENRNYFNSIFYYCWSPTNNKPVSVESEAKKDTTK